jgi:hypothetical protein
MYNILFTLNSSYFNYGKIFIRSLFDNNDMSKVSKVFVADTGLTKEQKLFFESFDNTYILSTGLSTDFDEGGTWGKGWQKSVVSKTKSLKYILEETGEDVMMIDADCLVLKDLSNIISDKSIQLCDRANENPNIPFLGSYIYIKSNKSGIDFVSKWIKNIDESPLNRAKESPMLGKTVEEVGYEDVDNIKRVMVSCYTKKEYLMHNGEPFIAHFKGGSLSQSTEEDQRKRIYGTHGFDKEIEKYLRYV